MLKRTLPFLMLLATLTINAEKHHINTDVPYSCGSCTWVNSLNDTLEFSNGIKIMVKRLYMMTHMLHSDIYWYLSFNGSPETVTVGLLDTEFINLSYGEDFVFGNGSDTVWEQTHGMPEILNPLPSYYLSSSDPDSGKWFFHQKASEYGVTYVTDGRTMKHYNEIIYVKSKMNNMKLQISAISISTSDTNKCQLDSIKMLWMVDSLKNGKFISPTNVYRHAGIQSVKQGKIRCFTFFDAFDRSERFTDAFFDRMYLINGRVVQSSNPKINAKQILVLKKRDAAIANNYK